MAACFRSGCGSWRAREHPRFDYRRLHCTCTGVRRSQALVAMCLAWVVADLKFQTWARLTEC